MGNAGRNDGEYYTPRPLIRAMVEVVQPRIGERIYDDACGSAGFLCESEKSGLFDVLAHVAYALPPLTREERANHAKVSIQIQFNSKQQVFLDFVLSHYVTEGVQELDREKLTPLLKLKYRDAIADAVADLGRPEEIGYLFAGFQKYLYQPMA
jgi:type I restriction enzyme, R subunit